ncbi:MAG: YgaP family membrane protein [Daejeonella sp.]
MIKNMGNLDRILRFVIAIVIVALYFTNVISGTTAIILLIVSVAFIITSFIGFCPMYSPFGIRTISSKQ